MQPITGDLNIIMEYLLENLKFNNMIVFDFIIALFSAYIRKYKEKSIIATTKLFSYILPMYVIPSISAVVGV
jgi:hypothetical protein